MTAEERQKVESIVASAAKNMESPFEMKKYLPLHGSSTYAKKEGGISAELEQNLLEEGVMFSKPVSAEAIFSESYRDWPNARGVAYAEEKTGEKCGFVWVNEFEHIRIVSRDNGFNIKKSFARFCKLSKAFESAVEAGGNTFVKTSFGYVGASTEVLGHSMKASFVVRLPASGKKEKNFLGKSAMKAGCAVEPYPLEEGAYVVSNYSTIGKTEVELINNLVLGVAKLVKEEQRLTNTKPKKAPPKSKSKKK